MSHLFSLNINIHIKVLQSLFTMIILEFYFKHIKKHDKGLTAVSGVVCTFFLWLVRQKVHLSAVPRRLGAVKCSFFLSRELLSAMSLPYVQCKSKARGIFTPKNCPPSLFFQHTKQSQILQGTQRNAKQEWAGHSWKTQTSWQLSGKGFLVLPFNCIYFYWLRVFQFFAALQFSKVSHTWFHIILS